MSHVTDQRWSKLKSTLSLQVIQFITKISRVYNLLLHYLSEVAVGDIGRLRPISDESTRKYGNSSNPVVGADAIKQKDSTETTGQKIFQLDENIKLGDAIFFD